MQKYFDMAALEYSRTIGPAMLPLVTTLIVWADLAPNEMVIDLGCGAGLAWTINNNPEQRARIVGIDISLAMAQHALRESGMATVVSDLHSPGMKSGTFDKAIASFVLNSTNPEFALMEIARLLKRPGKLFIQEWGEVDSLTEIIDDIFPLYIVDQPSEQLAALRAEWELEIPWDAVEGLSDISDLLHRIGYTIASIVTVSEPIEFSGVKEFINYKMAWPSRALELAEIPDETRRLCLADLFENLQSYTEPDGKLIWRPQVVRIAAMRE
jgi:SAM-dependent methyltransferase